MPGSLLPQIADQGGFAEGSSEREWDGMGKGHGMESE